MNGNTTFGETMKQCTKCLESFPATPEFFAKKRNSFKSQCKKCCNEMQKKYVEKNHKKVLLSKKTYYEKNKDLVNFASKKWYQNNVDKAVENRKIWNNSNREKVRNYSIKSKNKRRANKLNNGFEPYTKEQVLQMYGTKCHICNIEIDLSAPRLTGKDGWQNGLHIDHLVPISTGGADTLENVRPAHGLCNVKKGAKETTTAVPQLERAMLTKAEKR